jgi:MATE family multidrug resistance protein
MEGRQGSIVSANAWMPASVRKRSKSADPSRAQPDETTNLLPKPDDDEESDIYDLEDGDKTTTQLVLQEFWVLIQGSLPVIVAYTLQNSLQTISVLIVGRLSPEALATAAFAYMFAMATGWLIALGGTTAIDTIASATFTGSKNPHDLGVILQRAFIILAVFYVPVVIMWICAEPIFIALGQEAYLARDAARFLTVLAPGGLGYIYFECLKKFLQAQGKPFILRIARVICLQSGPRDYASRNLCSPHHFASLCWPELPFCLHFQNGPSRRASSYGNQLLAQLLPPSGLRPICSRLELLGRVE